MTNSGHPFASASADRLRSKTPAILAKLGELSRPGLREERFFLILSIFIGILSGLSVVCFRVAIEWTRFRLMGSAVPPTGYRLILAPTITGLLIAALAVLFFPGVRGSGVNQTKAALYIYNGYISFPRWLGNS